MLSAASAQNRMALTAGTRLGPYAIVAPLGAGGMGEVYQARDTRLDRTVAIKVLPPELGADPERRARFGGCARIRMRRLAEASVGLRRDLLLTRGRSSGLSSWQV
jgi:serine/threonine protein kinase